MMKCWTAAFCLFWAVANGAAVPIEGGHWSVAVQGWYTIDAAADGPASLSLIDRAAGTLASLTLEENAKTWKGRVSLVLEPGEYQIRWVKDALVKAKAEGISYPAANAAAAADAPVLADHAVVRTSLADRQSLVWQVEVPQGGERLALAIRGRTVAKAVLWKDGVWDVGLAFRETVRQPIVNRPYTYLDFDQPVPPGRYFLQVFGGPRTVWGDENPQDPFVVTRGGEYLAEGAVREVALDSEGQAEWLLGATVGLVEAEVGSGAYSLGAGQNRFDARAVQLAAKEPVRVVQLPVSAGTRWAVLRGPPGAKVKVRALAEPKGQSLSLGSTYGTLVASAESAFAADGYPMTAIVVTTAASRTETPRILWEQSLDLSRQAGVHLSTNNRQGSGVLIHVRAKGSYALIEKKGPGTAEYTFELYDDRLAGNSIKPQVIKSDGTVELQEKIYWVTSRPLVPGRTEWALVPAGLTQGLAAGDLWNKPVNTTKEAWSLIVRSADWRTVLQSPDREGVPRTIGIQSFPLDPSKLPVLSLDAGQSLDLDLTVPDGSLQGSAKGVQATLGGMPYIPGAGITKNPRGLLLNATSGGRVEIRFEPATAPPPAFVPRVLEAGATIWDDWSRDQTVTYDLRVPAPGLYRLETLGRLTTALKVRTPLHAALLSAAGNTGGTNTRLYAYLNPGVYRVEYTAGAGTAGRGGLSLSLDNGAVVRTLVPGTQARATVPGNTLLRIDLQVPRAATYLVTSLGLSQDFLRRLEDPEGYPVEKPIDTGGGQWTLAPGSYRLYSYPLPTVSRRIYGLVDVSAWDAAAKSRESGWNKVFQSTWKETPGRTPDEYVFDTDAPIRAQVLLDATMVWEARGPDGALLDRSAGGKAREISLPSGRIRFLITARSLDNLRDYSFLVSTRDLTPGRSIALVPQAAVPLAVGKDGTYELSTWGGSELGLSLYSETGQLVALGTPRTDDWNSSITAPLKAGRYTVVAGQEAVQPAQTTVQAEETPSEEEYNEDYEDVSEDEYDESESVDESEDGSEEVETQASQSQQIDVLGQAWTAWTEARFPGDLGGVPLLSFTAREEAQAPAASGVSGGTEVWGSRIQTRTFTTTDAGVYRFTSDAGRLAWFRLEKDGKTLAQAPGGFLIPLPAKASYRLSSWWEDGTDRPVRWSVGPAGEAQVWTNPERTSGRLSDVSNVAASSDWETPLSPAPDGWLSPRGSTVWWTAGESASPLKPETVALKSGTPLSVPLGGEGQSVSIDTPAGFVGLLTARGGGQEVGLSVQSGALAADWNWNQALVTRLQSAVGVPSGKANVRIWSPAPSREVRWIDLLWTVFPADSIPSGTASGSLLPGKAAVVKSASKALRVLLGDGLVAFALDGQGNRPVASEAGPSSGVLAGTSWAIVNTGSSAQPWRVQPAVGTTEAVTETAPYEKVFDKPQDLVLDVRGAPGSRLRVSAESSAETTWGDASTGRWGQGAVESGPGGERLVFDGGKGTLTLRGVQGWLRVWVAADAKADQAGLGPEPSGRQTLPAEGALLAPGTQGWTYSPPKPGFYSFEADGPGILAVLGKDGRPLASSWSTDRRSLLVRLGTDPASVYARPFAGGAQSGSLRILPLEPQSEGSPLLGPGERHLWAVAVKAPGRVGLGVESAAGGINLRLFRPDFTPLDSGSIFWRSLTPGTYWLVVEGTENPLRYRPVLIGLEGSRIGVPDEIRTAFEQGTAP